MSNKLIKSKIDAWKIESGKNSLTNYLKKLNYNIYVINSDGKRFSENIGKTVKPIIIQSKINQLYLTSILENIIH